MKRRVAALVLEVAGAVCVAAAAWLVDPIVGLAVTGGGIAAYGVALERGG